MRTTSCSLFRPVLFGGLLMLAVACGDQGPLAEGGADARMDATASHDASSPDAATSDAQSQHDGSSHGSSGDGATPDDAGDASRDSSADASRDSGTADLGCDGSPYALCEDFESAADGALPAGWMPYGGWMPGSATVTSAESHTGARSLVAASAINGQPRISHSLAELGATAGTHWGRIYYKVATPPTLPAAGDVIHNTLVSLGRPAGEGRSESRVVDTVVAPSGSHQFLYNLPDDSCCGGSAYDYQSYDGAWHCAEWYVDSTTQSFHFYFEGSEVTSIGFDDFHTDDPSNWARLEDIDSVIVGWINYQTADPPYRAWFDDLAIDDARIGCD